MFPSFVYCPFLLGRFISGKTEAEIYKKMAKAQTEINERTYIEPSKMTVGQWPDKLKTQDIQNFYNDLKVPRDGKPGLSPKTVKRINGVLHGALQQAVDIGYLRKNPLRRLPSDKG